LHYKIVLPPMAIDDRVIDFLTQADPDRGAQAWREFAARDPQAAAKYARFQQLDAAYRNDAMQAHGHLASADGAAAGLR
jgi:hypothetical protein